MPKGEGSLFDALDAALQRGSKRAAILAIKLPPGSAPKAGQDKLRIDFVKLSKSNAQRLLRFWQVREVSARSA